MLSLAFTLASPSLLRLIGEIALPLLLGGFGRDHLPGDGNHLLIGLERAIAIVPVTFQVADLLEIEGNVLLALDGIVALGQAAANGQPLLVRS